RGVEPLIAPHRVAPPVRKPQILRGVVRNLRPRPTHDVVQRRSPVVQVVHLRVNRGKAELARPLVPLIDRQPALSRDVVAVLRPAASVPRLPAHRRTRPGARQLNRKPAPALRAPARHPRGTPPRTPRRTSKPAGRRGAPLLHRCLLPGSAVAVLVGVLAGERAETGGLAPGVPRLPALDTGAGDSPVVPAGGVLVALAHVPVGVLALAFRGPALDPARAGHGGAAVRAGHRGNSWGKRRPPSQEPGGLLPAWIRRGRLDRPAGGHVQLSKTRANRTHGQAL